MADIQEYYVDGEYVTIWGEVKDKPDTVIVTNGSGYGDLSVVNRSRLVKKEDSYQWQQAQKRADELRLVTAKAEEQFEKVTEKVIKAACSALATRMKMNILFGEGMKGNGWAMAVVDELNKLVREKAPEVIKGKEDWPL